MGRGISDKYMHLLLKTQESKQKTIIEIKDCTTSTLETCYFLIKLSLLGGGGRKGVMESITVSQGGAYKTFQTCDFPIL